MRKKKDFEIAAQLSKILNTSYMGVKGLKLLLIIINVLNPYATIFFSLECI